MEGPIVSIDVSNGNSHYMCFIKNNKRFGKVKKIDHDIEGFKEWLTTVTEESAIDSEVRSAYSLLSRLENAEKNAHAGGKIRNTAKKHQVMG